MCCGKTLIQIFKLCFVVLLMASGVALIASGSYVTGEENSYIDLIGSKMIQVAIFEICLGIIIVCVSFVGCFWAWKESKMFLWAYIAMLCMICVMEFSGAVAAFVYKGDVANQTMTKLTSSFQEFKDGNYESHLWNEVQETVGCCGIYMPGDDNNGYDPNVVKRPASCCSETSECTSQLPDYYKDNCVNATTDALEHDANILGGMALGMGFLQVAGLLFFCADIMLVKCVKCMCPCC